MRANAFTDYEPKDFTPELTEFRKKLDAQAQKPHKNRQLQLDLHNEVLRYLVPHVSRYRSHDADAIFELQTWVNQHRDHLAMKANDLQLNAIARKSLYNLNKAHDKTFARVEKLEKQNSALRTELDALKLVVAQLQGTKS
jgi:hypothetical protein